MHILRVFNASRSVRRIAALGLIVVLLSSCSLFKSEFRLVLLGQTSPIHRSIYVIADSDNFKDMNTSTPDFRQWVVPAKVEGYEYLLQVVPSAEGGWSPMPASGTFKSGITATVSKDGKSATIIVRNRILDSNENLGLAIVVAREGGQGYFGVHLQPHDISGESSKVFRIGVESVVPK